MIGRRRRCFSLALIRLQISFIAFNQLHLIRELLLLQLQRVTDMRDKSAAPAAWNKRNIAIAI